jgi:uncharacterized short protein YbdD (DUF466 family)
MITWLRDVARIVRRVIGAPDYAAYLAHVRACHPDATPLTESAFVARALESRYSRPGSRCC